MTPDEEEFRQFRPYCVILASNPSHEALAGLRKLTDASSGPRLEPLQEYLIFPIQLYLRKPSQPENYTLAVLEFTSSVYSRTNLTSFFVLKDILSSCLSLVGKPDVKVSEDLAVCVLSTLQTLLLAASPPVLASLLTSLQPALSHLAFLALSWAESHPAPSLRTAALRLLHCLPSLASRPGALQPALALLSSLLPGILSKLVKVTQDTSLLQASVKALAVEVWGSYISLVLSDQNFPEQELLEQEVARPHLKDASWLLTAQGQVQQQISCLAPLASSPTVRVRSSLVASVSSLLSHCRATLCPPASLTLPSPSLSLPTPSPSSSCLLPLLDLLTSLSADTQEEVKVKACLALRSLVSSLSPEEVDEVCHHLTTSLHSLARGLRHSLGLHQEHQLARSLALLAGHLDLLQELTSPCPSLSPVLLSKLLQSLVRVVELDQAGPVLVGGGEDFTSLHFLFQPELFLTSSRPPVSFLHLASPRLQQLVAGVCHSLARWPGSLHALVQELLEGLQLEQWRREVLWLLGQVVEGVRERVAEGEVREVLLEILGVLLQEEGAGLGSVCTLGGRDIVREEWSSSLLSLACLGRLGRVLGHSLGPSLPSLLLRALHTTDLRDRLAAHTLYFALQDVAEGQGLAIPSLLSSCVEHLARDLNLELRKPRVLGRPGLSTLIRVVLRMAGEEQAQADLQDTMEILLLHLATSDVPATLNILNIVKVFVQGVREKMLLKQQNLEPKVLEEEEEKRGLVTRMIQELERERREEEREQEELLEAMNGPGEGFEEEQEAAGEEPEDDTEPPLTPDQLFLKVVVDHVRHFVSMSGQPAWQLASLASLSSCLALMATTPGQEPGARQTVLLPLIHQSWHSLRLLFRSNNIFVVDEAFQCLMVMASHARDFIRQRTVTDVLPPLLTFFKTLQVMVSDRERQATLAATQSRRILARLQAGIWDLLELLDLGPLETDPLIQLVVEYLGDKLTASPGVALEPRRNLDRNILTLKLQHKGED